MRRAQHPRPRLAPLRTFAFQGECKFRVAFVLFWYVPPPDDRVEKFHYFKIVHKQFTPEHVVVRKTQKRARPVNARHDSINKQDGERRDKRR